MSEHIPLIMAMAAAKNVKEVPMARRDDDETVGGYFDAVRGLMKEVGAAVVKFDIHIALCERNQRDIKEDLCGLKADHRMLRRWGLIGLGAVLAIQILGIGPIVRWAMKYYLGVSLSIDG